MITKKELMAVTDRKERFELSMLYMQVGTGYYLGQSG